MIQESAKQNSHKYLEKHLILINESLPYLEDPSELNPQNSTDVARRAIVLIHVIGIGFGQSGQTMRKPLEDFGLLKFASKHEIQLLNSLEVSEQERINATWLVESMQAIAWCFDMAILDPFKDCNDDLSSLFPEPFADPTKFIETATLRPFDEIYKQADLHYRLHWAARDCSLKGIDSTLTEGVIKERRKAIDWIIGVENDWDKVPTDT